MTGFIKASHRVLRRAERQTRHSAHRFALLAAAALAATPISGAQAASVVIDGVYEGSVLNICNDTSDCEVRFNKVPVGKTLHMTHMSCWGRFSESASVLVMGLDGSPRHSWVAPIQVGTGYGLKNFAVSAEVLKLYTAGSRPRIRLVLVGISAYTELECQIAGQLKP